MRTKLTDDIDMSKLVYRALTENHHKNAEPLLLQEIQFRQIKRNLKLSRKSCIRQPNISHKLETSETTLLPDQFPTLSSIYQCLLHYISASFTYINAFFTYISASYIYISMALHFWWLCGVVVVSWAQGPWS